jgi:4-oxalmesaconate hydratase
MIIDCHGHYTTVPVAAEQYRNKQIADLNAGVTPEKGAIPITDDELRETLENSQLKLLRERGTDMTIFSPRASAMQHHLGNEATNRFWAEHSNDIIYRITQLYPDKFIGVCQLPQVAGVSPANSVAELERCVTELGFVGCNLNPDPSGGYWPDPPLTDRYWYPIYEKMVELDVPAMIHVSASCNPNFHATGGHYLAADTTAVMQMIVDPQLFKDFPTLRLIIPHGGGAVPYHWGRYRGLSLDMGRGPLEELLLNNVYFDTCVYHYPGIELLLKVVPLDNILFASEMVGAVRGIDPNTGNYFDDTKKYIDQATFLSDADRQQLFEDNTRKVFPRLKV